MLSSKLIKSVRPIGWRLCSVRPASAFFRCGTIARNHLDDRKKVSTSVGRHILKSANEPKRPSRSDQAEALVDVSSYYLQPGRALEEEGHRDIERIGDLYQSAGGDPVNALLVLLHLLEGDTERVRYL